MTRSEDGRKRSTRDAARRDDAETDVASRAFRLAPASARGLSDADHFFFHAPLASW
jgi:hypothetical protein